MSDVPGAGQSPELDPVKPEKPKKSARERLADAIVKGGMAYAFVAFIFMVIAFRNHFELVAVGFFVALASAGLGCTAGFLFGIPKLADAPDGQTLSGPQADQVALTRMVFNTNLGQVSDWVTKIVIGLGIAQFGEVLDGARWLAARFATVFDGDGLSRTEASAFGLSLVIGATSISFLMMYMWTATRLTEVWSQ